MNGMVIYSIIAKVYDLLDIVYFRKKNGDPRLVVLRQINHKDRVLDICTGTASTTITIAKAGKHTSVIGIDRSEAMLRVAKRKVVEQKIKNLKLCKMDATQLKFQDKTFDKVLISLVLHEVEQETADKIILEARRVLKDNGRLIVTEWDKPRRFMQKVMFCPIAVLEPKPYRSFIKKDMKKYFSTYGFEMEKRIACDYTKVMVLKKKNK